MEHPPSSMISDCRKRKKPRTTVPNPVLPAIHVHNHLPGSGARIGSYRDTPSHSPPVPSTSLPAVAVKRSSSPPFKRESHPPRQPQFIIDLTNSDSDDEDLDDVQYPSIHKMLDELDSEFPLLDLARYELGLAENGFFYVNQLVGEEVRHQLQNGLGIPVGVVNQLLSRTTRVMRRTEKSKQKELKQEE